jgi:transketolase
MCAEMRINMNIEEMSVNAIRVLSADAIQKANSGHPGLPLGTAPIAYELFSKHMNYNPQNPEWVNRDRFVLSGGHGSMLLYSLFHLFGIGNLSLDEVKNFRQFGSLTPGHPEYGHTVGVEATTGPLGQGMAMYTQADMVFLLKMLLQTRLKQYLTRKVIR